MKQELQEHARDKSNTTIKKKSMTVYSIPYFKDSSGLVSILDDGFLKVIFHYLSSRPEYARVHGPCTRASGFHYPS